MSMIRLANIQKYINRRYIQITTTVFRYNPFYRYIKLQAHKICVKVIITHRKMIPRYRIFFFNYINKNHLQLIFN